MEVEVRCTTCKAMFSAQAVDLEQEEVYCTCPECEAEGDNPIIDWYND